MVTPDPLYRTAQRVWACLPKDGEFQTLCCAVCAIHITLPAKGAIRFSYLLAYKNDKGEWEKWDGIAEDEIFTDKADCEYYNRTPHGKRNQFNFNLRERMGIEGTAPANAGDE